MQVPRFSLTGSLWAVGPSRWTTGPTLVLGLLLLGCDSGHDSGHHRSLGHSDIAFAIAPRADEVIFSAVGEGGRDLFTLDLKTRRVTRIAATPGYEGDPGVSPDGGSVVYAAGAPGERADHLFLRSMDGKTVKQLTDEDADDASPEFSPDGSSIVFVRSKGYVRGALAASGYTDPRLCVMKADGSGLREVTDPALLIAYSPHFTRDGKSIYFLGQDGRYMVPADGSAAPEKLSEDASTVGWVLSPDGSSMAFSRGHYSPDYAIFTAAADGTNPRQLTHMEKRGCFRPTFTPDGRRLLFLVESWPDGPSGEPKRGLWEVDVAGGEPREIADYHLFDAPLLWRPTEPDEIKRP